MDTFVFPEEERPRDSMSFGLFRYIKGREDATCKGSLTVRTCFGAWRKRAECTTRMSGLVWHSRYEL